MTVEETIEYGTSKGLYVRWSGNFFQIEKNKIVYEHPHLMGYEKGIWIAPTQDNQQWLLFMHINLESKYSSLEQGLQEQNNV